MWAIVAGSATSRLRSISRRHRTYSDVRVGDGDRSGKACRVAVSLAGFRVGELERERDPSAIPAGTRVATVGTRDLAGDMKAEPHARATPSASYERSKQPLQLSLAEWRRV